MPTPKGPKSKATQRSAAELDAYTPPLAKHPGFTAANRAELAKILGSEEAAARIESSCAFCAQVSAQPEPDIAYMREQARGIAEASELLLRRLMALDAEESFWPMFLCDRPVYRDSLLRRPWLYAQGEQAWGNLLTHVDSLAASASEVEKLCVPKRGRRRERGLDLLGRNLVAELQREGLRASSSERSPLVRAAALVLGAAGFKVDAREFVRDVLRAQGK